MNYEKFTQKTVEALSEAQKFAVRMSHQQVDTEHLLLALLGQPEGLIPTILQKMNVNGSKAISKCEEELNKRPKVTGQGAEEGTLYSTQRMQKVLVKAEEYMKSYKDSYLSVEHLFLAIIDSIGWLKDYGITKKSFEDALKDVRGNQTVDNANPEGVYDVLNKFGHDLVAEARSGKLDPVIGRDEEI